MIGKTIDENLAGIRSCPLRHWVYTNADYNLRQYITFDSVLLWPAPDISDIPLCNLPIQIRRECRLKSVLAELDTLASWMYFVWKFRYFSKSLSLEEQDRVLLWIFTKLCAHRRADPDYVLEGGVLMLYLDVVKMTPVIPLCSIAAYSSLYFPHVTYDSDFLPRSSKNIVQIEEMFRFGL